MSQKPLTDRDIRPSTDPHRKRMTQLMTPHGPTQRTQPQLSDFPLHTAYPNRTPINPTPKNTPVCHSPNEPIRHASQPNKRGRHKPVHSDDACPTALRHIDRYVDPRNHRPIRPHRLPGEFNEFPDTQATMTHQPQGHQVPHPDQVRPTRMHRRQRQPGQRPFPLDPFRVAHEPPPLLIRQRPVFHIQRPPRASPGDSQARA